MTTPVAGPDALGGVADAVDAAILGYGLIGPALRDPAQSQAARDDEQAHRNARDQLLALLSALGLGYVLSDPGAALPRRVADDLSARQLAAQLEDAAAASWRALLAAAMTGAVDPGAAAGAAALALGSLTACAARAYHWRAVDTPADATRPFPGLAP
jgi:hypothetical protein